MKTELEKYTLWWDGILELSPTQVEDVLMQGVKADKISVTEMTKDIEGYNRLSDVKIKANHELQVENFDFTWRIPEEYAELDLLAYADSLVEKLPNDSEYEERAKRVYVEMGYFVMLKHSDLLRTLIYIVDTLKEKGIVWGVGRGSSCASYLLYLIGIHSVDPIKYKIPLNEFFRDGEL